MKNILSKRHSIRTLLTFIMMVCIFIPVFLTNMFFFDLFSKSYDEEHKDAITLYSESLNHSLEQYLEKYSTVFDVVSSSATFDQMTDINNTLSVNEIKDYYSTISNGEDPLIYTEHAQSHEAFIDLIDTYEENESIKSIYVGTPAKYVFSNDRTNGLTVLYGYNNGEETTTFDCTTRPWYIGAVEKQGDIYWSTPYLDKDGTSIVLSASKAVFDEEGELVAVISMDILSSDFTEQVLNFTLDDTYNSFIINNEGTYIFTEKDLIGTTIENQELLSFVQSESRFYELGFKTYTKAQNIESGWYIVHSYSTDYINQDMVGLTKEVVIYASLILGFTLILVFVTLNHYIEPLIALTKHFKKLRDTQDLSIQLPTYERNHNNEIGMLYKSVSNMQRAIVDSINKVEYLIYHDTLTKINNRSYFEFQLQELDNEEHLPLSVAMIDVNGLKHINDTFGHEAGDELLKEASRILLQETRGHDIVSRWGGDEFVILLPQTDTEQARIVVNRILEMAKNTPFTYGEISLAIGIATKENPEDQFEEKFKLAEEIMYQEKNNVMSSVRSETINTIINTLFEKSPETERHSERVSNLSTLIAIEMGLPENKINDIRIMGNIHDIGKIIIDTSILEKIDKLTDEEFDTIKSHSVIGSRILSSTNKYTRLVPGVLHHHERIDGTGYPDQLKGEEIPLESRIICVADAFDAMISKRPYKKHVMTQKQACDELIRCSGSQFDSNIVDIFCKKVVPKL